MYIFIIVSHESSLLVFIQVFIFLLFNQPLCKLLNKVITVISTWCLISHPLASAQSIFVIGFVGESSFVDVGSLVYGNRYGP